MRVAQLKAPGIAFHHLAAEGEEDAEILSNLAVSLLTPRRLREARTAVAQAEWSSVGWSRLRGVFAVWRLE